MSFRVAIIGCGRPGRGQARGHLLGYLRPDCEVVALADIVEENAGALKAEFQLEKAQVFTDYQAMLAQAKPDVVSVCLWPHLHAPAVLAAVGAGVRAIHCEKPMAPTWDEAQAMARACRERGVQLTFSHQRRFGAPFQKAKAILDAGEIGKLVRMEANCDNLFDWGTHWFDMMSFFNGDTPAEWVLAQMEWRNARPLFGVPLESAGLARVHFQSGVEGLLLTGNDHRVWGASMRLVGTSGTIEIGAPDEKGKAEAISLRYSHAATGTWQVVETGENLHESSFYVRSVADNLAALQDGHDPLLSARRALIGTELIFASYQSCEQRGKVHLPLQEGGSALLRLLKENGGLPENSLVG